MTTPLKLLHVLRKLKACVSEVCLNQVRQFVKLMISITSRTRFVKACEGIKYCVSKDMFEDYF